ncbi:MAG: hypothetical protein ABFD77_02150 [Thermotogota bacterium]
MVKKAPAADARAPQKKKRRLPPQLTVEKYNALQDAYFEKQVIDHAAKAAGVKFSTAKFYIEGEGRPDHGMPPIKQVWLDVQVEAQEKKQLTLLRFQTEQSKQLEEIVETTLGELKLVRAEVVRRMKRYKDSGGADLEPGATMAGALRNYERAVKLMERMLGAPDMTVATGGGEERYKNWSDAEIMEFMTTGQIPVHAR